MGRLQRVLSALAFWQPSLALFAALPTVALLFVILCGGDTRACFEVKLWSCYIVQLACEYSCHWHNKMCRHASYKRQGCVARMQVIAAVLKMWLPGSLTGSYGPQYRQLRTVAFLLRLYDSQLFWHISQGAFHADLCHVVLWMQ